MLDNDHEMTSKAVFFWNQKTHMKLHFFQSGKRIQHASIESFNGRLPYSYPSLYSSRDLADAPRIVDDRRDHYDTTRPHSSLGYP